jgi:hypothetical protein
MPFQIIVGVLYAVSVTDMPRAILSSDPIKSKR